MGSSSKLKWLFLHHSHASLISINVPTMCAMAAQVDHVGVLFPNVEDDVDGIDSMCHVIILLPYHGMYTSEHVTGRLLLTRFENY
jgi:hypothetical protein